MNVTNYYLKRNDFSMLCWPAFSYHVFWYRNQSGKFLLRAIWQRFYVRDMKNKLHPIWEHAVTGTRLMNNCGGYDSVDWWIYTTCALFKFKCRDKTLDTLQLYKIEKSNICHHNRYNLQQWHQQHDRQPWYVAKRIHETENRLNHLNRYKRLRNANHGLLTERIEWRHEILKHISCRSTVKNEILISLIEINHENFEIPFNVKDAFNARN